MGRTVVNGTVFGNSFPGGDGPMTKTERDGTFSEGPVTLRIDADSSDVSIAASRDNRWHLSVKHDARMTVKIEEGPSALSVGVKAPAVVGGVNIAGGSVVIGGSVRDSFVSGSSIVGDVWAGGRDWLVTLSLPAGSVYDVDARTGMGGVDVVGKGLRFGSLVVKTGSGDIIAALSNSRATRLDAKTGMGNVTAALPLSGGCVAVVKTGMGNATATLGRVGNARVGVSSGMGDKDVSHPDLQKVAKGRWATPSSDGDRYDVDVSTGMGDAEVRLSSASPDMAPAEPEVADAASAVEVQAAPETTPEAAPEEAAPKGADPAVAAALAGLDLTKMPEMTLDSAAAGGVSLTLPSGWLLGSVFSDPTLMAALDEKMLAGVAAMVDAFKTDPKEQVVWAMDAVALISAARTAAEGGGTRGAGFRFLVVMPDKDTKSPADLRKQAASAGDTYAPLAVEGADWAGEIRSTMEMDGKTVGAAMFLVGYEAGAVAVAFLASLNLFDVEAFRSIVKTIKPIV